jgi:RecJ-like exonuclease
MSETNVIYYVTRERPCPECDGLGIVLNSWWGELFEERGDEGVAAMSTGEIEDWFAERGFDYPPDQEVTCFECKGDGIVVDRVPLAHAMADLMGTKGELTP